MGPLKVSTIGEATATLVAPPAGDTTVNVVAGLVGALLSVHALAATTALHARRVTNRCGIDIVVVSFVIVRRSTEIK
jgi:hypothetical protein